MEDRNPCGSSRPKVVTNGLDFRPRRLLLGDDGRNRKAELVNTRCRPELMKGITPNTNVCRLSVSSVI